MSVEYYSLGTRLDWMKILLTSKTNWEQSNSRLESQQQQNPFDIVSKRCMSSSCSLNVLQWGWGGVGETAIHSKAEQINWEHCSSPEPSKTTLCFAFSSFIRPWVLYDIEKVVLQNIQCQEWRQLLRHGWRGLFIGPNRLKFSHFPALPWWVCSHEVFSSFQASLLQRLEFCHCASRVPIIFDNRFWNFIIFTFNLFI